MKGVSLGLKLGCVVDRVLSFLVLDGFYDVYFRCRILGFCVFLFGGLWGVLRLWF